MKINKQHDLLLYDSYQKKKENHSVREIFLYKEIISEFLEGFAKPGIEQKNGFAEASLNVFIPNV